MVATITKALDSQQSQPGLIYETKSGGAWRVGEPNRRKPYTDGRIGFLRFASIPPPISMDHNERNHGTTQRPMPSNANWKPPHYVPEHSQGYRLAQVGLFDLGIGR
jgi:hypothetical protein